MNLRLEQRFYNLLALAMQGLLYHCTFCTLYDVAFPQQLPKHLFLPTIYIPLFLFSIIRNTCYHFLLFLLMHIIVSGISMLFAPGTITRAMVGCCMALMALQSFHIRLKPVYDRQEPCPPLASVGLFFIIYLFDQFNHRPFATKISYYEIFLYLILFAAYKSLTNTNKFIQSNQDMDNLPYGQLKTLNKIILFIFILFLLIGMASMQYLPIAPVLSGIGNLLLMILKGILRFLFSLFDSAKSPVGESMGEDISPPPFVDTVEISPLLQLLEQLLKTVFYLLAVFILVKILLKVFYAIYQRFYEQHKLDTDESEFLLDEPHVIEKIKRKYKKDDEPVTNNTNRKIRRMYRKYIRRQFGNAGTVPPWMSPSELEDAITLQNNTGGTPDATDNANTQQRLLLYEKARYSQLECEKQEVDQFKQLL